jgi:hypothetical protein
VHWAVLALVLGVTALVLHSMGRPWWCKAGDLVPWSININSRHNSQHVADPYTVTHAMHGLILYGALWLTLGGVAAPATRAALALGVETAWEIIENTSWVIERYRAATISLDYYGDSVTNSIGDVLAFVLGYAAAATIPLWAAIASVLAAEVVLVLTIRDSLLLNVIMLIHPIEAVKTWQQGG